MSLGRSLRGRSGRRRVRARRRLCSCILSGALLVALLAPAKALAHAVLTHSSPHASSTVDEPPATVRFDFNEPIEATAGAIRLFDEDGDELSIGEPYSPGPPESIAAEVPAQLQEGVYTATYRVISADGHPVSGGFSFGLGLPVRTGTRTAPAVADLLDRSQADHPDVEISLGIARGAQYLALLLLIGSLAFRLVVWRRDDEREWPVRILFSAALLGFVSSIVGLVMQAALLAGVGIGTVFDAGVLDGSTSTEAGAVWAARGGLWLGLLILMIAAGTPSRLRATAVAALTAGVVATVPLGGHASTHSPEVVLVVSDVTHVLAAGAWLGALALLLVVYWPRAGGEEAAGDGLAATVRFSELALPAIVVLLGAGLLQSWFYLDGSLGELFSGLYGLLLLTKLALLAAVVAVAAANRRLLAEGAGAGSSTKALRSRMLAEVAVAILVLVVTAVLVRTAPPASAGGPQTRALDLGDMRIEMIIEPATTGPNDYHFYLFDRTSGAQIERVKDLTLRLTHPDEEIGPITLDVPYKSPAHYELLGPALGVTGTWEVALEVRVSRFEALTARTEIEVREP